MINMLCTHTHIQIIQYLAFYTHAFISVYLNPCSPPFSGSDQLKICAAVLKGIDAVEFPEVISNPVADFIKQLCR